MWWRKLPLHKSCPNEKLLAPMNFLHADVELLCFLLMLRMGLLQLCATGVKWHPARAQQRQLGVYLLLGCQSVRQSVWLSLRSALFVCLPAECWYYMGSCLPQCLPYFYSYRFKFYGSSCCKFRSSRVANFVFVAVLRHSFLESILLECLSRVP